jgi:hypothetical protein
MKGKPAWRAWLERFANSRGASSSKTIDDALELLAKTEGFEEPPGRAD